MAARISKPAPPSLSCGEAPTTPLCLQSLSGLWSWLARWSWLAPAVADDECAVTPVGLPQHKRSNRNSSDGFRPWQHLLPDMLCAGHNFHIEIPSKKSHCICTTFILGRLPLSYFRFGKIQTNMSGDAFGWLRRFSDCDVQTFCVCLDFLCRAISKHSQGVQRKTNIWGLHYLNWRWWWRDDKKDNADDDDPDWQVLAGSREDEWVRISSL